MSRKKSLKPSGYPREIPRNGFKLSKQWVIFFQKLLKAEANRRVRMCNLQSAKDCASVETSLATVRARAQEWRKEYQQERG